MQSEQLAQELREITKDSQPTIPLFLVGTMQDNIQDRKVASEQQEASISLNFQVSHQRLDDLRKRFDMTFFVETGINDSKNTDLLFAEAVAQADRVETARTEVCSCSSSVHKTELTLPCSSRHSLVKRCVS